MHWTCTNEFKRVACVIIVSLEAPHGDGEYLLFSLHQQRGRLSVIRIINKMKKLRFAKTFAYEHINQQPH